MVVDSRCVGSTVCFNFFVHFFGDMWNIKKKIPAVRNNVQCRDCGFPGMLSHTGRMVGLP